MLVSKSLYDGEDSMELPTVDVNKFSKALDTALKEMPEASINISADFQQGQLSRLITNISSCVYETWGSNYLPDFSTMPHAVSIPTDVDDVITIFKDLKDKSTQLRAYDKRVGKFVRAAFIRSLNKFEQSIMTTDLEEYTSAIAIWNRIYKHAYLRASTPFSPGYAQLGAYISPTQSFKDAPETIYKNRLALLYKHIHLTGESMSPKQLTYYKEYLAFITIRSLSANGPHKHEHDAVADVAFKNLSDQATNNPVDHINDKEKQSDVWRKILKTLQELHGGSSRTSRLLLAKRQQKEQRRNNDKNKDYTKKRNNNKRASSEKNQNATRDEEKDNSSNDNSEDKPAPTHAGNQQNKTGSQRRVTHRDATVPPHETSAIFTPSPSLRQHSNATGLTFAL